MVLNERFLLDKVVSSGSIGTLYLAYDQQVDVVHRDEARVAVTILSPDIAGNAQAVDTLQKISRRAGRLAHPHIVHFNDLGRDNGVTYLAKEWTEGRSLADILDSNDARRIDRVAAFRIVRELSIALDYAHRCGVVHADLKPSNIMIAPDGCARLIDSVTARAKLLRLRSSVGKTAASTSYASRQVLLGERLSASDDVFALGCLLYRLLAGYRVFGPRNAADAYAADMQPQRPEGLDDAKWRALEKALCHDREGRYESVPDFVEALDGGDNLSTADRLLAGGTGKGKRRAIWLLGATVLAVAIAAAGGYYSGILPIGPADVAPLPEDTAGAALSNGVPRQTVLVSSSSPEQLPASQTQSGEELPGSPSEQHASDSPESSVAFVEAKMDALPTLPVNAVGFADEYVVVYESDAAVQIDITRYNPDQQSFSIGYFVNDISANDGQDYFAPDSYSIKFGPGQATARLLIPLVQDAVAEGDESFVIRLLENDIAPAVIEAQSIVVTIRDGAPQTP
jgi:serine/threonine protein kinase